MRIGIVIGLIITLFFSPWNIVDSQENSVFEIHDSIMPSSISKFKLKSGYTKFDKKTPARYKKKTEEKKFYGGLEAAYIENFDLNLLLEKNENYVYIPKQSFLIFNFDLSAIPNEISYDLIIEGCYPGVCGCGSYKSDTAEILISYSGIFYRTIGEAFSRQNHSYNISSKGKFDKLFVKVRGDSYSVHPHGYQLGNIYLLRNRKRKNKEFTL